MRRGEKDANLLRTFKRGRGREVGEEREGDTKVIYPRDGVI